jgi:DNA replication initiation complex subunit (GINS family)
MPAQPLTYSFLREIQKKEMGSLEPVKLEKDFYTQLRQYMDARKASALRGQSFTEMRELENIRKVAKSIIAKRKEKLLMLAGISGEEIEGLTGEEQAFLSQVRRTASESFGEIDSMFAEQKEPEPHRTKVKIVKTIEAYKGFDNNIYGPFKEGEEILLPEEEAEWLLKSKMAEHLC